MTRDLSALAEREYDLAVVGGGIFGVCAAWDAALRGLSVALVERGDFSHATSANCFKIVHGGIRYLQHADLYRVRESSRERNVLLRIAPHLVRPLPVVVPTYGHGPRGKELLTAALLLYGLTTWDRNRGITDPQKRIPAGRLLSRRETLAMFPGLEERGGGLTGAAVFYDGQMYSPARLAFAYLKSAVNAGAEAANYVEATGFVLERGRVRGVRAHDRLSGAELEIRARVVLNAAGPWAEGLLRRGGLGAAFTPPLTFSRDAFFIVSRRLSDHHALALQGGTRDPDALLSRGQRHLFLVPWRGHTLVGVWHVVYRGEPDQVSVSEEDVQGFLDEVNAAYPALGLTREEVSLWNTGLVLFGDNDPGAVHLSYGKRSAVLDHAREHGIEGLVTLVGVRYTTSRADASHCVDLVFGKLGRAAPKSRTATTPLSGGRIECFEELARQAAEGRPDGVSAETTRSLVHNHGSEYGEVLGYVREDPSHGRVLGASTVIAAEVVHAVRAEMARKLGDVVFRRTDLGGAAHPGHGALRACAELMAAELGWDEERARREVAEVEAAYPRP